MSYVCACMDIPSFRARMQLTKPEPQIAVEIGVQTLPMVWPCRTRKKKRVSFHST